MEFTDLLLERTNLAEFCHLDFSGGRRTLTRPARFWKFALCPMRKFSSSLKNVCSQTKLFRLNSSLGDRI